MRARHAGPAAILVALAAMATAGCGFRPLYGDSTPGNAQTLAQIEIMQIADRPGQMLRNMLLDRLTPTGQPRQPAYSLSVSLEESRQELAFRRDESATRANLTVAAHFVLRALRDPQLGVYSDMARSTNSFNVLQSEFATLSAENAARERALRMLSEEMRIRIAAALQNPAVFFTPVAPAAPAPAR
jgi:LPS-assembly lipoprotein